MPTGESSGPRIYEYIPKDLLQRIQDTYSECLGIGCAIFDCELDERGGLQLARGQFRHVTRQAGRKRFCNLVGGSAEGKRRCHRCDLNWGNRVLHLACLGPSGVFGNAAQTGNCGQGAGCGLANCISINKPNEAPFLAYRCHAGLVDLVAPILVGETPVALMYAGARRMAREDASVVAQRLEKLSSACEIPLGALKRAYGALPEISSERIESAGRHLSEIADALSQAGHRAYHLRQVSESAASVALEDEPDRTSRGIVDAALKISGCDRARLWEVDPERDVLRLVAVAVAPGRRLRTGQIGSVRQIGHGLVGRAAANHRFEEVCDVTGNRPEEELAEGMKALCSIPCWTGERLVGMIAIAWVRPRSRPLTEAVVESLKLLGGHAAAAITNARRASMLREALAARDRFLADATHQLKTPLIGYLAAADVIASWHNGSPQGLARLNSIGSLMQDEAQTAMARAQDILAVSRGSELSLTETVVRPSELTAQAERILGSQIREKMIHIHHLGLRKLPAVFVDATKVADMALRNLLENAIRYTPTGGTISIAGHLGKAGVRISIRDRGQGMTPDVRARAFDRFFTDDLTRGLGLGLPAARAVMHAHQGEIRLRSTPEAGTRVSIEIPSARVRE